MLIVRCPNCGNTQKTAPKRVSSAVKRCVYCGKSFKVHSGPRNSRIVRDLDPRRNKVVFSSPKK